MLGTETFTAKFKRLAALDMAKLDSSSLLSIFWSNLKKY
jgi:hypothetical protein